MYGLTLYRRHIRACTKHYSQNFRVFQPTSKTQRARDCECPIAAEGTLTLEGLVTNRSTKTNDWKKAERIAAQWEQWGQTATPQELECRVVAPSYAVASFFASQGPHGRGVEKNTYAAFEVLLLKRFLPFCESRGYHRLKEFDSLDVTTKFTESWINLQPTRQRKGVAAPSDPVALAPTTKKAELERFRFFLRYCKERGWIQNNHAEKIKFTALVSKKFGMEADEEERIFKAVDTFPDGRGGCGGANARELRAFCLVMRHTGLRISDATTLNDTQLVERASGRGSALRIFQKKTQEWVYIPLPDFVAMELSKLEFKSEKDGRRYWFWTGRGDDDTAKNNWYRKIQKVVTTAGKEKPFLNPISPHTFRHTFSISHLNAGTDIKFVSRWLGHRSVIITEKHYAHAVRGTMLASEDAYDASMERQESIRKKTKAGHAGSESLPQIGLIQRLDSRA
jgi:integrase